VVWGQSGGFGGAFDSDDAVPTTRSLFPLATDATGNLPKPSGVSGGGIHFGLVIGELGVKNPDERLCHVVVALVIRPSE